MKKRICSLMLAAVMLISVFPFKAIAYETPNDCKLEQRKDTGCALSGDEKNDESKLDRAADLINVNSRDVRIYVTDGYVPLSDATVTFDGKTKETGDDGIVVFPEVETGEKLYHASVFSEDYGLRESEICVENYISKDGESIRDFTFSYWTPTNIVARRSLKKQAQNSFSQENWSLSDNNAWVCSSDGPTEMLYSDAICVNDKVLVVNREEKRFNIYDIARDIWTKSAVLPEGKDFTFMPAHILGVYNGLIYYMYGPNKAPLMYDLVTDTWAIGQSHRYEGEPHSGEIVGTKMYLYTKYYLTTADVLKMTTYNLETNTWGANYFYYDENMEAPFPAGHAYYDNKIYTFWSDVDVLNEIAPIQLLVCDYKTNTMTKVESWYDEYCKLGLDGPEIGDSERFHKYIRGSMVQYGSKVYFIGGSEKYGISRDTCYYDLVNNTWTRCASMPTALANSAATLVGSKIYVMGGSGFIDDYDSEISNTTSFYIYDIETDSWSSGPSLVVPRRENKSLSADKKIITYTTNSGNPNNMEMIAFGTYAVSGTDLGHIIVDCDTTASELQTLLQEEFPEANVTFSNDTNVVYPITWDVATNSDYNNAEGVYTVFSDVDYSNVPNYVVMPRSIPRIQVIIPYEIESIDSCPVTVLAQGSTLEEINSTLSENCPEVCVHLSDGTVTTLPVIWNGNNLDTDNLGEQMVDGELDLTEHPEISPPKGNPIQMKVEVLPKIISTDNFDNLEVGLNTKIDEVQAKLDADYPRINVSLSDGSKCELAVDWKVSASQYNGEVKGNYTIWGQIQIGELKILNPEGIQASISVIVGNLKSEILTITPNRFPESGAMEVKLGSTLEDIYNLLDTHTVELTLKSTSGSIKTQSATFQLLEEDNPNYDPMTEGTYILTAYLDISEDDVITSVPDELKVTVVVKTTKYKITSVKGERIGGVVSGTAFEDVPLPNEVTVNRNDGKTDSVGVTWDGSKYDPMKTGPQIIRGTLITPLPVHLDNPNNRQPSAIITVVDSKEATVMLQ